MTTPLRALALVCSLKPSPANSSTDLLSSQVLEQLSKYDVETSSLRVVDYDVKPGVEADMGSGDQWPSILGEIRAADILVLATPTWVGHMSSVAQRVLERLDAALSDTDDSGRPSMVGKVAVSAVVGNEDGAHKITADLFQALNDIGFSVPAQGGTYWNGEAMQTTDYVDLESTPDTVATTTASVARNAAHLARLLNDAPYPAYT
jgi:multimeric flavodoxin WrbA